MFLALDPSFSNLGYATFNEKLILVDVGVIKTSKSKSKITSVSSDDSFRTQKLAVWLAGYILKHKIKGIFSERPAGAMSASALKSFCIINSIIDCISCLLKVPVEWTTPAQTKLGLVGKKNAGKKEIMSVVSKHYNWKIQDKEVRTKKGIRTDKVYSPLNIKMGSGRFEHIADAICVFHYLKDASQIVKLYSN